MELLSLFLYLLYRYPRPSTHAKFPHIWANHETRLEHPSPPLTRPNMEPQENSRINIFLLYVYVKKDDDLRIPNSHSKYPNRPCSLMTFLAYSERCGSRLIHSSSHSNQIEPPDYVIRAISIVLITASALIRVMYKQQDIESLSNAISLWN